MNPSDVSLDDLTNVEFAVKALLPGTARPDAMAMAANCDLVRRILHDEVNGGIGGVDSTSKASLYYTVVPYVLEVLWYFVRDEDARMKLARPPSGAARAVSKRNLQLVEQARTEYLRNTGQLEDGALGPKLSPVSTTEEDATKAAVDALHGLLAAFKTYAPAAIERLLQVLRLTPTLTSAQHHPVHERAVNSSADISWIRRRSDLENESAVQRLARLRDSDLHLPGFLASDATLSSLKGAEHAIAIRAEHHIQVDASEQQPASKSTDDKQPSRGSASKSGSAANSKDANDHKDVNDKDVKSATKGRADIAMLRRPDFRSCAADKPAMFVTAIAENKGSWHKAYGAPEKVAAQLLAYGWAEKTRHLQRMAEFPLTSAESAPYFLGPTASLAFAETMTVGLMIPITPTSQRAPTLQLCQIASVVVFPQDHLSNISEERENEEAAAASAASTAAAAAAAGPGIGPTSTSCPAPPSGNHVDDTGVIRVDIERITAVYCAFVLSGIAIGRQMNDDGLVSSNGHPDVHFFEEFYNNLLDGKGPRGLLRAASAPETPADVLSATAFALDLEQISSEVEAAGTDDGKLEQAAPAGQTSSPSSAPRRRMYAKVFCTSHKWKEAEPHQYRYFNDDFFTRLPDLDMRWGSYLPGTQLVPLGDSMAVGMRRFLEGSHHPPDAASLAWLALQLAEIHKAGFVFSDVRLENMLFCAEDVSMEPSESMKVAWKTAWQKAVERDASSSEIPSLDSLSKSYPPAFFIDWDMLRAVGEPHLECLFCMGGGVNLHQRCPFTHGILAPQH